jgi:hypothetical protein
MSPHDDFENRPETADPSHEFQPADFKFERQDWTLFRSLETLGQKAGVPANKLRRLCLKELVDNALDASPTGHVRIEEHRRHYEIYDDGNGIEGTPEEIAALFSIKRGLVSSKLWRKPQRGALGNGLRVVAGALIASGGGSLVVTTRDRTLHITPKEDGGVDVVVDPDEDDYPVGTFIGISFGPHLPEDSDALVWAKQAIAMAKGGEGYTGKSSPHWFDASAFHELVSAAGGRKVRDLIANFDGCTGAKAGKIASRFLQCSCDSLTRAETTGLLRAARAETAPVSVDRLGAVGKLDCLPPHYSRETGTFETGALEPKARIPFVVEAWARELKDDTDAKTKIDVYVNRTPITGEVRIAPSKDGKLAIWGCNLRHYLDMPTQRGKWEIALNITAPYAPITTDGKEPNLAVFADAILDALSKAIDKAHKAKPTPPKLLSILPRRAKGNKSEEIKAAERAAEKDFCDKLKAINETLDIKVSSRGWAYVMEEYGLNKGDFDDCQKLITECRKNGLLPYDFCTEDERREAEGFEPLGYEDPDDEVEQAIDKLLHRHEQYRPFSFWDGVDTYVEMAVEKVDLKSLFGPICAERHVLISNKAGWSDINSRAAMMLRFKEMQEQGKRCVLLYCGDFDPGGLRISDFILKNFEDLSEAVGWSPDKLVIDRFGLNFDFIEAQKLTWIDNLETGSGGRLDDPGHRDHDKAYVRDYLEKYCKKDASGKWRGRKVEANALVVRPEAARQLCREALAKYIDQDALDDYEAELEQRREQLRRKIAERLADAG